LAIINNEPFLLKDIEVKKLEKLLSQVIRGQKAGETSQSGNQRSRSWRSFSVR